MNKITSTDSSVARAEKENIAQISPKIAQNLAINKKIIILP